MANTLHFSASTSVKNLFGRGLVTDQVAAVFELVKNSYDADATEVEIIFSNLNTENSSIIIYELPISHIRSLPPLSFQYSYC